MEGKNVMLIDDNEIDSYVAGQIISDINFARKLTNMSSALSALEYLKKTAINSDDFPDIIFLDIRMPVMDGFDFLDEFLKLFDTTPAKCAVIMLTSSTDRKDIDRALQYPMVRKFLAKPLRENMLKELINLL